MLHRTHATAAATLVLLAATASTARADNVVEYELDNGLDVILRPVSGAETTAVMTLFDIGELHDPPGRSGQAHLMEHLLVTGATDASEAMSADQWFMQFDGPANAQTGLDYTVIAGEVANDAIEEELNKAAERMQSLTLTEQQLERERQRMRLELDNMYHNMPWLVAMNRARQVIDPAPEGARRGGVMDQVEPLTVDELQKWHMLYYRPNNARLIVVGDFDADAVAAMIDDAFADIPPGTSLPSKREQPAFQKPDDIIEATARGEYGEDVPTGFALIAYKAPQPGNTEDMSTFLLMVPRIYREILSTGVRQSQYVQVVMYPVLDDPGAMYIKIPLEPGDDGQKALQTIRDAVSKAIEVNPERPVDRGPLQHMYGALLGLMRMPDSALKNRVYSEAFRLGRIRQLNLDLDAMRTAINQMDAESVNATAAQLFDPSRSVEVIVRSAK